MRPKRARVFAELARQPDDGLFTARLLTLPGLHTDSIWLVPADLDVAQSKLTLYSPRDFPARLYPVADYWRFRPRPEDRVSAAS